MSLTEEEQALVDRVKANCELLVSGYKEKVEYETDVAYHQDGCKWRGKSTMPKPCECPVNREKRVRQINRPGYLAQLHAFAQHKDTDRNPKAERGAPRVKTAGKPPGDLAGFFALDELHCAIVSTVDAALREAERDVTWASQPVGVILGSLSQQTAYILQAGRPDVARTLDLAARRWVDSARSTLRISTAETIFDSVACGNCGGSLSTPAGNRGEHDVVCIGSHDMPPCGESYPVTEWLRLYEDHRRRS